MNDILYAGKHATTYNVGWHWHECYELIFCTSGKGKLLFRDRELPYSKNTLAVIPGQTPHANISEEGVTNIHLNMDNCTFSFPEPVVLETDPVEVYQGLFRAVFYYYSRGEAERSVLLPAYGQLLAATISLIQPGQRHSDTVLQIENEILHNFPDPYFDLNAYLRSLPFSLDYLKRLFKQETGMTPLQFLTDKRLEHAAGSLAAFSSSSRGNISEVARLSGFSEPLYFSRLFKKKYGVSPRSYVAQPPAERPASGDELKILL